MTGLKLPITPHAIQKGVPLKLVLDEPAVTQLGRNLRFVYEDFDEYRFIQDALVDIDLLSLKARGSKIAEVLKRHLPNHYTEAIEILLASLTEPLEDTADLGLSGLFYLPHVIFVAKYGLDKSYNNDLDPFDVSMRAQYEITKRFSAEFSIRSFIRDNPDRTFAILYKWMYDEDPHVRRLCSEGTRPRLPWATKLTSLIEDPSPCIPILRHLKDDVDLYVRRSVANHVGDIAKDDLDLALDLCSTWLTDASKELKWVIRHALRHPAKKNMPEAMALRKMAK